jgi:GDPmannose 4,6-dehydratase
MNYEKYVKTSPQFERPLEVESLLGDPTKAREIINWRPRLLAPEIARIMVEADLQRDEYLY